MIRHKNITMTHKGKKLQNKKSGGKQMGVVTRVRGKGDYSTMVRKMKNTVIDIGKELRPVVRPLLKAAMVNGGGVLGGMAGTYLGNPSAGSAMGSALGAKLSKLLGSGDYVSNSTECNSLFKGKGNTALGSFDDTKGVRVRHREFLADVISPGSAFNIESYPLNPGLPTSFPYLAPIASSFEEFRFNGLVFEFVSTATPYSTTPNMGSVIMSCEYNTAAGDFTSKIQMENSEFAISSAPYKSMAYGLECAKNWSNNLFVRSNNGGLPGPLTDLGTFFIATNAVTAGTVGELWVTYDITFSRPRQSTLRYGTIHLTNTSLTGTALSFLTGGKIKVQTGSYTSAIVSQTALTVSFPDAIIGDVYRIITRWGSNANITTAPLISAFTGLTGVNALYNSGLPSASSSSLTSGISFYYYSVTAANPALTFTDGVISVASSWSTDIEISNVGGNLGYLDV